MEQRNNTPHFETINGVPVKVLDQGDFQHRAYPDGTYTLAHRGDGIILEKKMSDGFGFLDRCFLEPDIEELESLLILKQLGFNIQPKEEA